MAKKILLMVLFLVSVNSFSGVPEYSYVTDRVDIPVRSERSFGDNILLMLSSGDRLEIIETNEDGWSKIRYGTTEGWMIARYIMKDVGSLAKLNQLQIENKLLSKENVKLIKFSKINRAEEFKKMADNLTVYAKKDFSENIKEYRRKDKEFEMKKKGVAMLAEKLSNRLKQLESGHPVSTRNIEYQQKRTIAKLEANLKLHKKKLEYAAKNLKLHKKKIELVTQNLNIHKKKISRYQEISKLKKEINLEQSKEREIEMKDLLNIVKAHYVKQIATKVKGQWRYQGAEKNWGCDIHILQDIDGKVQSVNVQSCNVDNNAKAKSFKNAIERAVYKASPLPPAPDKSVFDREILFHFRVN